MRTLCPGVDITGVETVETRMIAEGGRFRTFVLVALPMGQANTLKREKTAEVQRQQNEARGNQVFSEMDQRIAKPTQ